MRPGRFAPASLLDDPRLWALNTMGIVQRRTGGYDRAEASGRDLVADGDGDRVAVFGGTAWRWSASMISRFTSSASASKTRSVSSLASRTPASSLTAILAASRWLADRTVPVSVKLPSFALASTPAGTSALAASALFTAVVSM